MALLVAARFFYQILLEGRTQINAGLVGQADEDKEDVGHFVGQIIRGIRRFETLVAIQPGHQTGHFTDFFHENGRIGQLRVITDTHRSDPFIYSGLNLFQC